MRCSRVMGGFALLAAPLALSGCGLFLPCSDVNASLVGSWAIETVNGDPIPANGIAIPGSSDRLLAGTLSFRRTYGACTGLDNSLAAEEGPAVARYSLVTATGAAQPSPTYGGTFNHDVEARAVTLAANGRSQAGTVSSDRDRLFFSGNLPSLGGLTVVFRRVP